MLEDKESSLFSQKVGGTGWKEKKRNRMNSLGSKTSQRERAACIASNSGKRVTLGASNAG